ncbi:hypothetical protein [Pedobacter xixiisoli]|uniref:Outer membrane protein beta-barrel domain-containing protein n=1 Tax=Pedobacter xixiisoli TaxID=1476464 RepID=A0A285ZX76_9SPHI|nr:hypothetical protein [Pedobacter xixiisoli]SOD14245.1 hypothetical protein SAMN06297358_1477 [Pedobacter xixiisoli]
MKILFIICLSALSITATFAQAQTKKSTGKTTTTKKTTPIKTVTTSKTTSKPVESSEKTAVKSRSKVTQQSKSNTGGLASYKAALGLKFIYGVSATGKVFLKDKHALEGIVRYNGAGGLGSNIAFTALYQYHNNIKDVDGLRWYIGGGGYVNHFSWKDNDIAGVTTFGASGVIGLEYKIKSLPLAISADWVPGYVISKNIGFSAENGGIGIKYTF